MRRFHGETRPVCAPRDFVGPSLLADAAAHQRDGLRRLCSLGLHDAFRLHSDAAGEFSWWDYRQAAFRRNLGLRIDLTLVSDALRARCAAAGIDREPRTWDRPSDHAPAWVELGA